ncbi:hypothetical protein GCM10022281_20950 [Sphingomonas rosea]|uniref:Lipoprotein n=1 Tax=Sphingomonas rosea TaxID=335605 RepID=A0ABP7UBN1_9SPHN
MIVATLGLSACDVDFDTDNASKSEKVAIEGKGDGQVKFDLPFAKGNIKLPEGMMKDANFDIDGVKMYPDAKIDGFSIDAGTGKDAKVNFAFNAPATPDAVRGYFLEQFKAKGVDARATAQGLEGTSKDGDTFAMAFVPQGSGTKGSIVLQDKARN